MYCTKCGRELSDEAIFCPGCGSRIKEKEVISDEEKQEKVEYSLNEKKEMGIFQISFLVCSIIIAVIVCLFYVLALQIALLSLSLVLMVVSLIFYIKKRNIYMFLSFAIAFIDMVFCAGMIIYICSLK